MAIRSIAQAGDLVAALFQLTLLLITLPATFALQGCNPVEGTLQAIHVVDVTRVLSETVRGSESMSTADVNSELMWSQQNVSTLSDGGLCSLEKHEKVNREIVRRGITCN